MANSKKGGSGKVFEEEIKASFPPEFFLERYKDDTAGYYGVTNPADYRAYKFPLTFLIECKSHKGKSLPLAKIRENQLKGLVRASTYHGIYGGFLINYRDLEETYYLTADQVQEFVERAGRKSIPAEWCRENGIRIEQKKKITRYTYDLDKWLGGYYE